MASDTTRQSGSALQNPPWTMARISSLQINNRPLFWIREEKGSTVMQREQIDFLVAAIFFFFVGQIVGVLLDHFVLWRFWWWLEYWWPCLFPRVEAHRRPRSPAAAGSPRPPPSRPFSLNSLARGH